jgi:hypothetical protein
MYIMFADSLSVAILALQCVEHDHRNRNVKPLLKKPLATLIALQQPDGGFGSLHTTALAIRVSMPTEPLFRPVFLKVDDIAPLGALELSRGQWKL